MGSYFCAGPKLYCVLFFVGLCFAAWSAFKWKNTVDDRFDLAQNQPKKYTPTPDSSRFAEAYHRTGRYAAIRVFHGQAKVGKQPQPLFWAKGNLLVISKVQWQRPDLAYVRCKISRDTLHQMIDDVGMLPTESNAQDDLVLTHTLANGTKNIYYLPQAKLETLLSTWLKERTWKPFAPQALAISGMRKEEGPASVPWPFRRLSMKKILKGSPLMVGKREVIRRIQEIYRQPQLFRKGELYGFISIQARVDR